ncbi:hypothetical protein [Azospirillum canadense]|uniref:hypothetical protein n=1 Tax=Azospirillum canadense TaxID=403962 RepID=UPI0022276C2D|nr:hypothetical protein [Azospirillum canadense]MCW2240381.1 hypothetical protein [Azospirillum canadense]
MIGILGACAYPGVDQALNAQRALVGMPKATLLSCAGLPDRQAATGGQEHLTYQSRRTYSSPTSGGNGQSPSGTYTGSPVCEATFTMRNGVVQQLVYGLASSGNWSLYQCYTIVQKCLPTAPH